MSNLVTLCGIACSSGSGYKMIRNSSFERICRIDLRLLYRISFCLRLASVIPLGAISSYYRHQLDDTEHHGASGL